MCRCLACAVVVAFAVVTARGGPVAAQGARDAAADLSIAALLEQRVPEELAVEGVMLSRRGLTLQVEQFGSRLLVSLVDRRTGRVAASTKIDRLSEDRDAAVAITTHVVADMVSEISERIVVPPAPPPPAPPPAPKAIVEPKAAVARSIETELPYAEPPALTEADRRAAAELRFRRESIGIGSEVSVYMVLKPDRHVTGVSQQWYPYRGAAKARLEPAAFFALVGRSDLVKQYRARRQVMLGLYGGGGALALASAVAGAASIETDISARSRWRVAALAGMIGGLSAIVAGRLVQQSLSPISDGEARAIGEQYNVRLRRKLGLPPAADARRDVRILPYVGERDAGLAVLAAF